MTSYSPPPTPQPMGRTSTPAIISLIAGILGFFQILPVIGPIAAVISGHMAKKEIKNSGGLVTGNGMATTGLILGYLMLALTLCVACVFLLSMLGVFTIPFLNPSNFNFGS